MQEFLQNSRMSCMSEHLLVNYKKIAIDQSGYTWRKNVF